MLIKLKYGNIIFVLKYSKYLNVGSRRKYSKMGIIRQ